MNKDVSRRSSTSSRAHTPSQRENGDEASLNEPHSSGEALLDAPYSSTVNPTTSKSSENGRPTMRAEDSEPMSASNSASSGFSVKDVNTGVGSSAIPYGTRSRNRTGASRPNYAEDKEMDAEFETYPSLNGRKAVRANDGANTAEVGSSVTPQQLPTTSDHSHPTPSHYREPIPGTSTFSANPTAAANSKKRKAATQALSTPHQLQAPIPGASTSQSAIRRSSTAAPTTVGFRDSNMLSFDQCGGQLKGKKLIADDGTVLEVNGNILHWKSPSRTQ